MGAHLLDFRSGHHGFVFGVEFRAFTTSACRVALCCIIILFTPSAGSADDSRSWQRHRERVSNHPQLVRYYTFENVTIDDAVAGGVAGERVPLTYRGADPLRLTTGSCAGKQAVRLDNGSFQGGSFEVPKQGFTVEMRFRKVGQGAQLGNGRTNGMLLAVGDGYWNGLRVWTDYPQRRLRFEIGRPKPSNAFGMMPVETIPDGVWHHLAAMWDGREMRLYLNGIPLQATEYAGPYTAPSSPLRIGFAGAGVGSVEMDVDEFAVYRGALAPDEVLQHAIMRDSLPPAVRNAVNAGGSAIARQDWVAAERSFSELLQLPGTDSSLSAVARLGMAQVLRRQNRLREAIALCAALFDNKAAPQPLRDIAARMCLPEPGGAACALATRRVYGHLLELEDVTAEERIRIRICLAECLLDEKDPEAARQQFEELLQSAELPARLRWGIALQLAHAYLSSKDFPAARTAYARLASDPEVTPDYRGMAALCSANTYVREKAYAAAAGAYSRILTRTDLPTHLRAEAEERLAETQRLQKGLPARDPAVSHVEVPSIRDPAVVFYVAPNGDDSGPGTVERPFASLQRARDAIRETRAQLGEPAGGATVYVRGGHYRVGETLELTAQDSGTREAAVVYRAMKGETPVFSGGVTLDRFQPVTDPAVLERLDVSARGKVMQVNLADCGVTDYGSINVRGYGRSSYPADPWVDLYVDGRAAQLARWPNEVTIAVGEVTRGRFRQADAGQPGQFFYDSDRPEHWAETDEVWMFGAWGHLWEGRCVQVADLDARNHRVTTVQPTSYGYRQGQPFYFFNVLEELDQPGEWYLDRRGGLLYLYPPAEPSELLVQFPILEMPFVTMQDVSYVSLRGLSFELGRGAGAVVSGGRRNLLAGCSFGRLGGNGVIIRGGTGHGLLGCDIHSLGAGGVRLSGGDRKTLTSAEHFVENCHVYDFSRVDRVYAPAVHVDGVGHRIAHNLFHDSPHHAMRVEGYEHTIEFNEIHSVVYEFDDQAGIDMFGNPAYRGNVIRYNFWHHIGSGHDVAGQSGIRLDDMISAVRVYGNVFYRCAGGRFGGVQIHGGKDNIVDNNLFIDCKAAISFSPWGQQRWLERLGNERTAAAIRQGGVDVTRPPYIQRYPDLARLPENPDRNFIWRNLAVDCGQFTIRDRGVNESMDNHAFFGDPGFADPDRRDFTLADDSPVYDRFGFRPIPFREIGLYESEHRATWPVEHTITPHYVPE